MFTFHNFKSGFVGFKYLMHFTLTTIFLANVWHFATNILELNGSKSLTSTDIILIQFISSLIREKFFRLSMILRPNGFAIHSRAQLNANPF